MSDKPLSEKLGMANFQKSKKKKSEYYRECPNCGKSFIVMTNGGKFVCLWCFVSFHGEGDNFLELSIIHEEF